MSKPIIILHSLYAFKYKIDSTFNDYKCNPLSSALTFRTTYMKNHKKKQRTTTDLSLWFG